MEERILDKTRELFFRYGLKNVTMDDIAKELGISKKTLYAHFDKKKSIVKKVTENYLACQSEQSKRLAFDSTDAIHELIAVIHHVNSIFESMDVRIVHDMQKYFPEAWKIFEEHKQDFILKMIKDNLQRGIDSGLFRKDIDIEIIARMRMEQIILAMNPSVFPTDQFDIKVVHHQLLLQYVHGVSTTAGRHLIYKYLNKNEE